MIKHYRWLGQHEDDGKGLVAFAITASRVIVKQLSGNAPPPSIIPALLNLLDKKEIERLNFAYYCDSRPMHQSRRVGMSGCRNYIVRRMDDVDLLDAPIRAFVHVSMYGKLNEGLSIPVGEVVSILAIMELHDELVSPAVHVEEVEPQDPAEFGHRRLRLVMGDRAMTVEEDYPAEPIPDNEEDYLGEATLSKLHDLDCS